jgi:hypothetical protein
MPNVLSELLGEEPRPWLVLCQHKGGTRWIACSSYATKEEAKARVKSLNLCYRGERTYRCERRK